MPLIQRYVCDVCGRVEDDPKFPGDEQWRETYEPDHGLHCPQCWKDAETKRNEFIQEYQAKWRAWCSSRKSDQGVD